MIDYFANTYPEMGYDTLQNRRSDGPENLHFFEEWYLQEIDNDVVAIKLWWQANKILYHEDGTHSWKEEPIPVKDLLAQAQKKAEENNPASPLNGEQIPAKSSASSAQAGRLFPWWIIGIGGIFLIAAFLFRKGKSA